VKVVDASIIASFILKEEGWEKLTSILEKALTVDHAVKETSNAIWKAYRRKILTLKDAETKFKALLNLTQVNLEIVNELDLAEEAFKIACEQNVTIYDALYLALAKEKNLPLYTLDKTQAQVGKTIKIKIVSF